MVQITISVRRAVIIDDDVHLLDINTVARDISDQNMFLKGFEDGVSADFIEGINLRYDSSSIKITHTFHPAEDPNGY